MAKITYEDKVDVLVSSLPNKNKVNAGDMNQIKNGVNELEADISNGVVEAKTYANTKVNDLVIGGTNILLSTQKPTDTVLGGRGILTDTMYKNCYVVTCDNIGSSASKDVVKWDIVIAPEPDTEYTLSFWAKGSGRMSSFFYSDTCASGYSNKGVTTSTSIGEIVHTLESNWTKYIITWKTLSTVSGNKTVLPCRILAGGNLTGACAFKFEIGNKATDWSPNSEDLTSEAKTYTDTKNDNLVIGGRNYFRYGLTSTLTVNIPSLISQTGSWGAEVVSNTNLQLMLEPATTYRIRYKFRLDSKIAGSVPNAATDHGTLLIYSGVSSYPVIYLNDNRANNSTEAKNWVIGSVVERKAIFTTPVNMDSTTSYRMLAYTLRETDSAGNVLANSKGTFFDIKIEKGDKYTGFSIAPEDRNINIEINSVIPTDITGQTIDINKYNYANGCKQGSWLCASTGGASNITNLPRDGAFLLKLESSRLVSVTDYRQKQIITFGAVYETYERWDASGTWSNWTLTEVKGVPMLEDSGWITPTLNTGLTHVSGVNVQYRKVGKRVEIRGRCTGVTVANTDIFTLASGYRPSMVLNPLTSGSGLHITKLEITTGGIVRMAYRYLGGTQVYDSTAFITFDTSFFVD